MTDTTVKNGAEQESRAAQKSEAAQANFRSGMNCCQAVLLAFEAESGLNRETLLRLGAPFGGGMGRLRQVCGALTGAFMLSGLLQSDGDRAHEYTRVQRMAAAFEKENGSILCRELLQGKSVSPDTSPEPSARTEQYYKKRPCVALTACAAKIVADALNEEKT